jgi:hypothetical protein
MHADGTPAGTRGDRTVRVDEPSPGVRVITLNRPHRLNTISGELISDLHRAIDNGQQVSTDCLTHIAGCKSRNLAEPGPERQNGRVSSAGFFEDRWRGDPHPSLSRELLRRRGFGSSRS